MGKKMTPLGRLLDNNYRGWTAPQLLNLAHETGRRVVNELQASGQIQVVVDQIDVALAELYDIHNPANKDTKTSEQVAEFADHYTAGKPEEYGIWAYFPWQKSLVHFPPREDLRLLRTARNRNLVTSAQQGLLYQACILIAGLSVGSNAVESLLSQGIGGKLILVDMDVIEPTNLNRIRARYKDVGIHKVEYLARLISETDPFIEQIHVKDGLNEENLRQLLLEHKPDIIVDEMDTLEMKIKIRLHAQELKKPVIMAADNANDIILDIERYDLNDQLPILHGRIPADVVHAILAKKKFSRQELAGLIGKYFIGLENTTPEMLESLSEVGKSLPSWPQLGGAAALSGIYLAYCSKKIILGQPLTNGRHIVGPDRDLDPDFHSPARQKALESLIEQMKP